MYISLFCLNKVLSVWRCCWGLGQFWMSSCAFHSVLGHCSEPQCQSRACAGCSFFSTADVMLPGCSASPPSSVGSWVLTSPPILLAGLTKHLVANPFFLSASCLRWLLGVSALHCSQGGLVWFVSFGLWVPCQLLQGLCRDPVLPCYWTLPCWLPAPVLLRPGDSDIWQEKGNSGQAQKSEAVLLQAGPWVPWHDMKGCDGACWSSVSSGSPGSCWLPTALVIPATVAAEGFRAEDVSGISKFFQNSQLHWLMFWSVPDCEFPRPCLFAENVERKHFGVSYLMVLKSSQKIQSSLEMLYLLISKRAFSPLLCFTDFFQYFFLVVRE